MTETKWGFSIPQGFLEGPVDLNLVRAVITRAEALNFHSLWVLGQNGVAFNSLEAVSLLTYAAALTTRVRLGTSVLVFPLYNPVQLGESLATLDVMSGGRLIVGLGMGNVQPRYPAHGVPGEGRVRRFIEGVRVMKAMWTEPSVTFQGQFVQVDGLHLEPKPAQKPHPPIWFGGYHPDVLKRTVRLADGWMGAGSSSTAKFRDAVVQLRQLLEQAGRDPASCAIAKRVYVAVDDNRARAEERLRACYGRVYGRPGLANETAVWGPAGECAEKLAEVVAAGADLIALNPMYDQLEQLEVLHSLVISRL